MIRIAPLPLLVFLLALLAGLAASPSARAISAQDILGKETTLTLQEAIELALANNLDLRVARIEPVLAALRVDEASGAFNPNLSAGSTFDHTETPNASTVQSAFGSPSVTVQDLWTESAGINGVLPFGLQYSSTYTFLRTDSSSGFNALEPEFRASWTSELTLPILKNFLQNDAKLAVDRSRVGRRISRADFETSLTGTVVAIETAYWNLTATREQQRVTAKSVETARNLLEDEKVRYDVGVVSKVNVTQAEAGLAQREVDFITARNAAEAALDQLLDLIVAPSIRGFDNTEIRTLNPTFVEYAVDEGEAVEKALQVRPEVMSAREGVADAELQVAHASNQHLPALDLKGSYGFNGLTGSPKTVPVIGVTNDSHNVHDEFLRASGPHSWSIGANLSYPIFNDTASSRLAQRRIELRRARTTLRKAEQTTVLDVRGAVRTLRNSLESIKAAERRRTAARETLEAERERLRLGDSTPFQVLEFEEDEAEAEVQVIRALQAYRNAVTALDRAQASLLDSRGIRVDAEIDRAP